MRKTPRPSPARIMSSPSQAIASTWSSERNAPREGFPATPVVAPIDAERLEGAHDESTAVGRQVGAGHGLNEPGEPADLLSDGRPEQGGSRGERDRKNLGVPSVQGLGDDQGAVALDHEPLRVEPPGRQGTGSSSRSSP